MEMENKSGAIAPWLLWALVGVIVIAAGYFGWQYMTQKNATPTPIASSTITPTKSATPTQTVSASTVSTADWKTYENTKYNYSIKYPQDWDLIFQPQNPEVPSSQSGSFNLANFKLNLPIYNFDKGQIMIYMLADSISSTLPCSLSTDGLEKAAITALGDVKALRYDAASKGETESGGIDDRIVVRANKNNICYEISLSPANPGSDLIAKFDQILSTFQFTK